jgi:hypothetical protein
MVLIGCPVPAWVKWLKSANILAKVGALVSLQVRAHSSMLAQREFSTSIQVNHLVKAGQSSGDRHWDSLS